MGDDEVEKHNPAAAAIFKALGDENRWRILETLKGSAQALPFYAGNKFYLIYLKTYSDVRMVACSVCHSAAS